MNIKKQTGYIILIFISIILLCLYFGKSIIHEGIEGTTTTMSTTGPSVNYSEAQDDLTDVKGIKEIASGDYNKAIADADRKLLEVKAAEALIHTRGGESGNWSTKIDKTLHDIIDSTIIPPVVYLPLYNDAINIAKKNFPDDPSNQMNNANVDVNGKPTNLQYTTQAGKKCIYFNNDMMNYLSFPIYFAPVFSVCYWIYIDVNQSRFTTVVSMTNKQYMVPAIQFDLCYGRLLFFSAHTKLVYDYTVTTSGWVHVAYTFKAPKEVTVYINKTECGYFVDTSHTLELDYFSLTTKTQKSAIDDYIKYVPDTLIIGRSGDNRGWGEYTGHIRDFSYYAMVLTPTHVANIYDYTK